MRILIADKFESLGLEALESRKFEVILEPELDAGSLPARQAELGAQVIVVRSTKVSAACIEASQDLALVVRAGAGYDNIDLPAASSHGVFVANCPGKNSLAVAELAWGLIIACDRRIPDQVVDLRNGDWNKKEFSQASGLAGRTLGILGAGRIGRAMIDRAKAFGMEVAVWDRFLDEEMAYDLGVTQCKNLINLAKMSHVISIHVAAVEETRDLINDKFVDAMRPGSILVNTSRGSIVDEDALRKGIREKGIRAGLDVFADEPSGGKGEFSSGIVGEPGVYGTHHVGASTKQAQESTAMEAVRIISSYRDTGDVPNCVNKSSASRGAALLTVRHLNQPGVLAKVFDILSRSAVNVEEMENLIYEGGKSACARIQVGKSPSMNDIEAIESERAVLGISVSSMDSGKEQL
ncbi:MAG: phosphoglycerate dehydrogenase [Planctomycetota bacterium]|nr:phosphoglycerate dehydrogenase [Planctomycetota bacterium]